MPDRQSIWRFAILMYAKRRMLQVIRIYRLAQRVSSFAKNYLYHLVQTVTMKFFSKIKGNLIKTNSS